MVKYKYIACEKESEEDDKIIIIGNANAITYKEIFPLIKENKVWLGCSLHAVKCNSRFHRAGNFP